MHKFTGQNSTDVGGSAHIVALGYFLTVRNVMLVRLTGPRPWPSPWPWSWLELKAGVEAGVVWKVGAGVVDGGCWPDSWPIAWVAISIARRARCFAMAETKRSQAGGVALKFSAPAPPVP